MRPKTPEVLELRARRDRAAEDMIERSLGEADPEYMELRDYLRDELRLDRADARLVLNKFARKENEPCALPRSPSCWR